MENIDWTEFTGRVAPQRNEAVREALRRRRVLITGAGGFIGSALAQAIAAAKPALLLLLDQAEAGLYELQVDLRARDLAGSARFVVGDVKDAALLREIFEEHAPQIVFHAAACKHVPLMEENPFAAAATNILGTRGLLHAARRSRVEKFVLLSTDKAVEPRSIMGATKRVAELLTLCAGSARMRSKTLRLGNVLGSTGSVGPLFVRQIAHGGPVTVSHPEATRYFLSLDEAVEHLLSCVEAEGAEVLLVPRLDRPRRITELAEFLIERSLCDAGTPEIVYTGLRPGDKLRERLMSAAESCGPSSVEGLLQVQTPAPSASLLDDAVAEISDAVAQRNVSALLGALRTLVPEFEISAELREQAARLSVEIS